MTRLSPMAMAACALAALAAVALVVAFGVVTDQVARQGELRRQTTATHWQARWRCNQLRSASEQRDCLATLPVRPAPAPVRPA